MEYIEKNGCRISEITLGTVQLGMSYGINNLTGKPSYQKSCEILDEARKIGICSYDTSNDYGDSEELLGKYFSAYKNEAVFITKIGPKSTTGEAIKKEIFESVRFSLEKLKTDSLPFLLLHHEKFFSGAYEKPVVEALKALKSEGKVKNIGVSFSDKERINDLFDTTVFDCVQFPLNLFDNKEMSDGTLKKLKKKNITVFIRSAYLQGLFFVKDENLSESLSDARPYLEKIRQLADEECMTVAQLAVSFLRNTDEISSVLLGCERPEQVRGIDGFLQNHPLSQATREKIIALAEEIPPHIIRPWEWER